MPIQVQYTNNISAKDGIKCLVYGEAGSGKTRLCATAPNPLILSAESGLLSLRKTKTAYLIVKTLADMGEYYNYITKSADGKKYDTICLDSISEIAESILEDEKKKVKDPRKAYGETQDKILEMIRGWRDIQNKNIYFSAKQGLSKDGGTGIFYYGPMLPGQQLPLQVPYFFDELFQLSVLTDPATGTKWEALRCQKDNQYQAKDRSGNLEVWEEPNLTKLFNKIMKG